MRLDSLEQLALHVQSGHGGHVDEGQAIADSHSLPQLATPLCRAGQHVAKAVVLYREDAVQRSLQQEN